MSALPRNWVSTTFGEIAAGPVEQRGPEAGSFTYVDISSIDKEKKRIVSPQQLENSAAPSRAKQHLRADDVLVSMTRPNLNAVARVPKELGGSIGSTGFCVLRSSHVSTRWLEYRVQANDFIETMSELVQGALYPAVRPKDIFGFKMLLPPREEQDRIADEIEKQFTRLADVVAALKRVQANLKRYRASVLKAACEGRLVPTEAELTRKEGRDYEPASELLKRILTERRANWEANQLQKMIAAGKPPRNNEWKIKYKEPQQPVTTTLAGLPEGWIWSSIGQVFSVHVGATPSRAKAEYWGGDILWVSSGEVAFCRIKNTSERITRLGLANSSTEIHPPGTVLLGMIGEGKTRGQVAILNTHACNNQNSAAIRVAESGFPPEYVYYYLEGEYERTRRLGSGNNQPALNKTRVEQMLFPLPPLAEQNRIVTILSEKMSNLDRLETECAVWLRRTEQFKNSILQKAFEGKLVPQDPLDEPASVLLERIRAERTKPTGNGKKAASAIQAFFGTWPGDETDEEVLDTLMDIRKLQRRRRVKKLAQSVRAGKG